MSIINKGKTSNGLSRFGEVGNLQEVTTNGNETNLPIKVAELQLYDNANAAYGTFVLEDDQLTLKSASGAEEYTFSFAQNFKAIFNNSQLTANRTFVLPDVGGDISVNTVIAVSSTAKYGGVYGASGTITFTDPTPVTNKGYIVHVIGGTSTIGGVGYTTGALVYRFYNGSVWTSKNYGLSTASDFANDAAASAGGIPIGDLYHTSGTVKIRLV